jgi:hypothetical protein
LERKKLINWKEKNNENSPSPSSTVERRPAATAGEREGGFRRAGGGRVKFPCVASERDAGVSLIFLLAHIQAVNTNLY